MKELCISQAPNGFIIYRKTDGGGSDEVLAVFNQMPQVADFLTTYFGPAAYVKSTLKDRLTSLQITPAMMENEAARLLNETPTVRTIVDATNASVRMLVGIDRIAASEETKIPEGDLFLSLKDFSDKHIVPLCRKLIQKRIAVNVPAQTTG
jgi:hypothetical protein